MSHTVAVKTEFNNWKLLEKSFNKLGWTLKQNSKIRTYPYDPQRTKVYDWIAVNPHVGYDVGIAVDHENKVQLHYDTYGGSVEKTLGTKFAKLKTQYVLGVTAEYFEEIEILEQLADGSMIIEADDGY